MDRNKQGHSHFSCLTRFSILYLHLFLAELEVDYCVCVQAYHQIDEVVRQAVAAQHFEECRSRNGIKCLNQIDKRDISLKVMLLSLSQCHEEIESTIDGPSLWTKSTLILWSVLLHDFFQPLYHHARQDFGRNIQKTYAAPVLRLSKVSLLGQKNQLGFQPFRITDTSVVRTIVKLRDNLWRKPRINHFQIPMLNVEFNITVQLRFAVPL